MSLLVAAAPPVPLDSTAGRYVAAAYIVVLALILAYVAIMAVRAQHLEKELEELRRDVEAARAGESGNPETEAIFAGDREPV
ncbi:MAG TPA: CcmD family protein [Solirubrobacteraceae bacterium]|jgi:CcmD family protein|nr:CcmD family protein [Solirubrobacteraceae bacterium]